MSDNSTAIAYTNEQKGTKSENCTHITQEIWYTFMERTVNISAAHVPGIYNIIIDSASCRLFWNSRSICNI